MTEKAGVERERTDKMLILGFDAGCGTCRDIARRVEGRVGDALAVRNLADPELTAWREEALGKDAPFAPTLFEVEGDTVRAWTGKKMALPLSRKLGLSKTWQLMQALGEMPNSGIRQIESPGVGMSRGKFLKGVGGAAVAMSVFSGVGSLASVVQAREPQPFDVVRIQPLTGSQAQLSIRHAAMSADSRTVIGNRLNTVEKIRAAKPSACRLTTRSGKIINGATFRFSNNQMLLSLNCAQALPNRFGGGTSSSRLFNIYGEGDHVIYSGSTDGKAWRRPQSGISSRSTPGPALGGCKPVEGNANNPPNGYYKAYHCKSWDSISCGLNGGAVGTTCYLGLWAAAAGTLATFGGGAPFAPVAIVGGCVLGAAGTIYDCCEQWVPYWCAYT